jgi:hypothetical protein
MPPRPRPRKRKQPPSGPEEQDTSENVREGKKPKTLPHRSKIDGVFESFLDKLIPVASALEKFNDEEEKARRAGVVPLDIGVIEMELYELHVAAGIHAKHHEIDSFLRNRQVSYENYADDPGTESKRARDHVRASLDGVVLRIKEAREQLPGLFSHWVNYWRKAKRYFP